MPSVVIVLPTVTLRLSDPLSSAKRRKKRAHLFREFFETCLVKEERTSENFTSTTFVHRDDVRGTPKNGIRILRQAIAGEGLGSGMFRSVGHRSAFEDLNLVYLLLSNPLGTFQVGTAQDGMFQVGIAQVGTRQVGIAQEGCCAPLTK
jgi:hypothetical protein